MAKKTCIHCGGSGQVTDMSRPVQSGNYQTHPYRKTCPVCGGTGKTGFDDIKTTGKQGGNCLIVAALIVATATIFFIAL